MGVGKRTRWLTDWTVQRVVRREVGWLGLGVYTFPPFTQFPSFFFIIISLLLLLLLLLLLFVAVVVIVVLSNLLPSG